MTATASELMEVRDSPQQWFEGFGRIRDEETRAAKIVDANVLQRRVFEHYRRCQQANKPCRMAVLKYRRAGSSSAATALAYVHAQNYESRIGAIGTDYKASSNLLDMISHYAEHDDFPGWLAGVKEEGFSDVPWIEGEKLTKTIATRLEFATKSTVELYTAQNPESARSAGLNAYVATEAGRWPTVGVLDAAETLSSMRNALPKKGFHLAIEESTANGAQGSFYETCRGARWPADAPWVEQFRANWPLQEVEFGRDLQFVFIFAAWFEDSRHVSDPLTEAEIQRLKDSLDEDEKTLISRFGNDGPLGKRLGNEVETTLWQQLAWRRGIIATVCTKRGALEFSQEYPSTPEEAFLASGSPVFDSVGMRALEEGARSVIPAYGSLDVQPNSSLVWRGCPEREAVFWRWEVPEYGRRYIIIVDPMSGADQITNSGIKDRHSVLVLRDGFLFHGPRGDEFKPIKLVCRIRPPCQWDNHIIARWIALLSRHYGGAPIVVEANIGIALLTRLRDEYRCRLYQRQDFDNIHQVWKNKLGWVNSEVPRREAVAKAQEMVREQQLEIPCRHLIGEMQSLVFDEKGKAVAAAGAYDDDVLALCIGLTCMPAASEYTQQIDARPRAADEERWVAG